MTRLVVVGLTSLAIAGCGTSSSGVSSTGTTPAGTNTNATSPATSTDTSPTPTDTSPATTSNTTSSSHARKPANASGLTGLGAATSVFDAHHTPNNEAINSAGVNGVDSVQTIRGRVTGFIFDLNAKPPLGQGEALAEAQAELPHDARALRARRPGPTCAQVFYRSATLNRLIGEGVVLIEFESGNPGDPYRASAVDAATFTALPSVDPPPPC